MNMKTLIENFRKENKEELYNSTHEEYEALFVKELWHKMEKVIETSLSEKYPAADGYDGYVAMQEIKKDGFKILPSMGNWPYVIYAYNDTQFLSYVEGDIYIRELKK